MDGDSRPESSRGRPDARDGSPDGVHPKDLDLVARLTRQPTFDLGHAGHGRQCRQPSGQRLVRPLPATVGIWLGQARTIVDAARDADKQQIWREQRGELPPGSEVPDLAVVNLLDGCAQSPSCAGPSTARRAAGGANVNFQSVVLNASNLERSID